MSFSEKRKKVEKLVIETLKRLEKGGVNAEKYRKVFADMSDKQFLEFFKKMKTSDDFNFYVEVDLYGKNTIDLRSINDAANYLKVPLEEYVYLRHKRDDGKPIRTIHKVPVLYIHLKRMQQLLSKKNIMNPEIDGAGVRNKITGSLNSDNKSGRFTDADLQALISVTASADGNSDNAITRELLGPRGDNTYDKRLMYQMISLNGDLSLEELDEAKRQEGIRSRGQAVKSLDEFLLGAGIVSDLDA